MTLFETIAKNPALALIDTSSDKEVPFSGIPLIDLPGDKKQLCFMYLDNSFNAVSALYSGFRSPHCLALLAPGLNVEFKNSLEALYQPAYIFDAGRTAIEGYELISNEVYPFFKKNIPTDHFIHADLKLLISTSGTTGSPKFVKLSETNLLANAASISDYLPINPADVTPLNLPLYYSYGLSVLISNSINGGKIACINDDILSKPFWEKFELFGFTSIAGVPFVYEMLDRIGFTKKTYPSLKYITQAGGKLHDKFVVKYGTYATENNIDFFVMYGQTEATARLSYLAPEYTLTKTGSIGKPIKNGYFYIDEEGSELCYTGPNVSGGYANQLSDLAHFEPMPVLHTGDMARKDEDGFYYITGRLKRFVKLFGNRINLDEVEAYLSSCSIDAKCAGYEDKYLYVFLSGQPADNKQLTDLINRTFKIHPTAIKTVIVSEMPLTSNGKVDYNKLISQHASP